MSSVSKEDLLGVQEDIIGVLGSMLTVAERHQERLAHLEIDFAAIARQLGPAVVINNAPRKGKLLMFAALVASAAAGGVVGYKFYEHKVTDEGYLRWKAGQDKEHLADLRAREDARSTDA